MDSLVPLSAVFLLVFLRPFGMSEIGFAQSALYWLLVCVTGYGLFASTYLAGHKLLARLNWKYPYPLILLTGMATVLISLVIPFLWSAYFGRQVDYVDALLRLMPQMLTIGTLVILVTMTRDYIKRQRRLLNLKAREQVDQDAIQNFIKKLPRQMQGELLCIGSDDHYLNVHTDKGKHMMLMPLTDALKDLKGAQGLRVHRSWWVNESAVVGSTQKGRNFFLTLKNDISVPVSRSYLKEVKERNLL